MSKIDLDIFKHLFLEDRLSYHQIAEFFNTTISDVKQFNQRHNFKYEQKRNCLNCGKEFVAKRHDGKFCCHHCQQAYNNKEQTYKRARNKPGIYKCQYCGKEFEYTPEKPFLFGKTERDKFLAWKFCCYECARACVTEKNKKTSIERYGTDCVFKNPEIAAKRRKTWDKKYGDGNCPFQDETVKAKARKTNLEKYGHENVLEKDCVIRQKIEKDLFEQYGIENIFQLEGVKEKAKQTRLERYGAEYTMQSSELQAKVRKTNLKKYGCENPSQNKEVRAKAKKTTLERYGVEYAFQNPILHEKMKNTCKARYGVPYPMMLPEIREQARKTCKERHHNTVSMKELFILYLLLCKYPHTQHQYHSEAYPFNCDFYIPDLDTYIEYQGFWHHGTEPYDPTNVEHLEKLNTWKNKSATSEQFDAAIEVWTIRDPLKRETAKKNNLNWLEFFTIEEFLNWYKTQNGTPLLEYKSSKE